MNFIPSHAFRNTHANPCQAHPIAYPGKVQDLPCSAALTCQKSRSPEVQKVQNPSTFNNPNPAPQFMRCVPQARISSNDSSSSSAEYMIDFPVPAPPFPSHTHNILIEIRLAKRERERERKCVCKRVIEGKVSCWLLLYGIVCMYCTSIIIIIITIISLLYGTACHTS